MRKISFLAASCLLASLLPCSAQNTPTSQMEKLSRGIVALPSMSSQGEFVSWRLLGTDNAKTTTFDVVRDGKTIASNLKNVTSFLDKGGNSNSQYQIVTRINGTKKETSKVVKPWSDKYLRVKLNSPGSGYTPNDINTGDVDGDGEYELVVKWNPNNAKDNSQAGKTDPVYLDCYKLSGKQLWRIDLGYNIRAGAHYTQFLVYDFDGDGKAEVICKTAPLSKDGRGNYVTAAATDNSIRNAAQQNYRNSSGYVNAGPEYLTVFNGQTGAAIHTVYYNPNRAGGVGGAPNMPSSKNFWGDTYGGRADRFLSAVAYLDGPNAKPSAIFTRGYYTRAYIWAVNFDGRHLSTKWLSASTSPNTLTLTDGNGRSTTKTYNHSTANRGSNTMYGNGNHNLSIADVDGDGCDEIIWGSAALDNNGYMLYATGYGHGDAIHLGKFIPDRKGLQVFEVHETKPYGWDLHDAATGQILYSAASSSDNGRGMAGAFIPGTRGGQFSSFGDRSLRSAVTGKVISNSWTSCNFRIYWDGSLYDQWFDKDVTKWNGNGTSVIFQPSKYNNSQTCNTTKATPCLQADLFGDWREEIVMYSGNDNSTLNIFTTTEPTEYRIPTLMHDHTYRMAIAWQQAGYNQPPHLGYYLPDYATYFNANSNITVQDGTTTDVPTEKADKQKKVNETVSVPASNKEYSGTIHWNFDNGTANQSAEVSKDFEGYLTASTSLGENLVYGGVKQLTNLNETRVGVKVQQGVPTGKNALRFNVQPAKGCAFTPTRVDFTATRIGTEGGLIDANWDYVELGTKLHPARNKENPEYTTYTYNVKGDQSNNLKSLILYLYQLETSKQFGIANVTIYGKLSRPAKAEEAQTENGTIKWKFDQGNAGQQAVVGNDLQGYVTTDVQMASGLTYGGTKELSGLTETRIGVTVDNDPAPSNDNKLSFVVSPVEGYSLNITRIEFTATRIGTDGGNIDVSWAGSKIASGLRPARNMANPEYTTYTYNVSTANPQKGHKLTFNFYNIGITKQFGLANIKLYGTLQTAGAKANGFGVTDGIENIEISLGDNNPWYTLSGMRVEKPSQPGLYIHNGKKVMINK